MQRDIGTRRHALRLQGLRERLITNDLITNELITDDQVRHLQELELLPQLVQLRLALALDALRRSRALLRRRSSRLLN